MNLEDAIRIVEDAASYGIRKISITGGEPLLFADEIKKISEKAANLGIAVTVLTNGFWGDRNARSFLLDLKKHGVVRLVLSTDEYHAEFVPVERFITAAKVANNLGFRVGVVLSFTQDMKKLAKIENSLIKARVKYMKRPVLARGRGANIKKELIKKRGMPVSKRFGPCSGFPFPMVMVDGRVLVCCFVNKDLISENNGIIIGNTKDKSLDKILKEAESNYFVKQLGKKHPFTVYQEHRGALNKAGFKPEKYQSICDFCTLLLNKKDVILKDAKLTK
jgi:MoaA/NifB/PqqE/SkfB family radical SAM enzyme